MEEAGYVPGIVTVFFKTMHFWHVPAYIRWTCVSSLSGSFELL
jgi:hypothetical protein